MKKFLVPPRRPVLNMAPLIDILFVVVVFLSVGTELRLGKEIPVVLPQSSSAEANEPLKTPEIAIDADGALYLNREKIAPDELAAALQSGRFDALGTTQLEIDENVPHRIVISVLDILRTNGFSKIGFSTRE